MSFVANFTASQIIGIPATIIFEDTSVFDPGDDTDITERRIYLYKSDGNTIVYDGFEEPYIYWPYPDPITLQLDDLLNKDYALNVYIQWYDSVNNVTIASKSKSIAFTMYSDTFDYQLTQVLAGNPVVINDNNFFPNKMKLRCLIESAQNALTFGDDITSGQICLDQATQLRVNSQYYFNTNS
jgi:hypothetical protein